jgi:hypothetical protein
MGVWLIVLVPSAVFGILCTIFIKKKWAIFVSGLVPWFSVLAALLYSVYVVPYEAMDASMWPVAQFFGGNAAAFAGVMSYLLGTNLMGNKKNKTEGKV